MAKRTEACAERLIGEEMASGNITGEILKGCDYNALTSKAIAGKNIIAMVTNKAGTKLLAVAGQQGLSFNMSSESSEASTKDMEGGGWSLKFHGSKSWDASIDGLYSPDDEATQMVAKALADDEYLCLKICKRTVETNGDITYQPLRMGLAIVTSDNFEAANEDNTTYSMDFEGSGKPWLYETATEDERNQAKLTIAKG